MALLIATFLAGAVTYVFSKRIRQGQAKPLTTPVVAAAKDLPAGVALTPQDVTTVDWPASMPLPGAATKAEDVIGHPLIYPLETKEPVMKRDLALPGSGLGLSVKIPEGMRATSVRSNEVVGVAGYLYPGSHVDVLGTFNPGGGATPVTQTILQNVEVVTAGTQIEPDPQGKPQTVNVVTLLLTPEDSQKLLLSSTQGTIQFVLRSGADAGKTNPQPTRLSELVAGVKPPQPPASGVRRVVAKPKVTLPSPPPVFVMEVIQGEKRSEQKF